MPLNRLLYVLIGAALAAGLLVSVLVRPQPMLAASEDCYGLCTSLTALSLSSSTVAYGDEEVEKFGVTEDPVTGVPTGYVVVESRAKIVCRIHLSGGKGSCSPAARALRPGSYTIVAHYSGDKNFKPSTSSKQTLTVLRPSVTALSLSRSTVVYGDEQVVKFGVKVSAGAPGTGVPTGHAVVMSGTRILCSISLSGGKGSCSPAARALRPGSRTIVAHYTGDKTFEPSTSSRKALLVLRF
ncbi:MAG TPA: Ig-like domain-containing protein [Trebonia sp.]